MSSSVALQLVTWNSASHLPALFASLKQSQLFDVHCQMFVLDNASSDNTVSILKHELQTISFPHQLIELHENTGFAGGHNRLFGMHEAEYTLLVNPDLVFETDCIEKMVRFLDEHPEAAAVAPRLMRLTPSNLPLIGGESGEIVDSLGLQVFRNRRVVEIGAGEQWLRPHPDPLLRGEGVFEEVFGLSGACALFRTNALKDVSFADGTFFDVSYGSYKEDVDLAFRLQSSGHRTFVLMDAVAYHARGAKSRVTQTDTATAKNKQTQSLMVRTNSYKNHVITLYKNEYWQNLILDFPWILWYELKKFVYLILFDRAALKGLREVWKMRKELREKRKKIREKRTVQWKEVRKWFV